MRIHLSFDTSLLEDRQRMDAMKQEVISRIGLHDIHESKFYKCGILTGEIEEDFNPNAMKLPHVVRVSFDERKYVSQK